MLQCSFSFAAAQLLVQMTSALQKRQCCSAVPAAQHSENCSATSVFACGVFRGLFKGGVTEGGVFHTRVRGTMFVRNGAVTPGPSRECDITFFVKGRPKSARQSRDSTVAARSVQSVTVPSSRVSRECRSPGLRSPPLKKCPSVAGVGFRGVRFRTC